MSEREAEREYMLAVGAGVLPESMCRCAICSARRELMCGWRAWAIAARAGWLF